MQLFIRRSEETGKEEAKGRGHPTKTFVSSRKQNLKGISSNQGEIPAKVFLPEKCIWNFSWSLKPHHKETLEMLLGKKLLLSKTNIREKTEESQTVQDLD